MASKQQYVRQYNAFRGVDFTSDPVDVADYRVQYAVNMWRDYENNNGSMIETIPGFRRIYRPSLTISEWKLNGLHQYRSTDKNGKTVDYLIIHLSNSLFYLNTATGKMFDSPIKSGSSDTYLTTYMENSESKSVMANNKLILVDGKNIITVEPNSGDDTGEYPLLAKTHLQVKRGDKASETYEKYIPTTYFDGEEYEAENLFSEYAYEKFNNDPPPKPDASGLLTYQIHSLNFELGVDEFEITMGGEKIKEGFSGGSSDSGDESGVFKEYQFDKETGQLKIKGFVRQRMNGEEGDGEFVATNYGQTLTVKGKVSGISFPHSNKYPSFLESNEKSSAIEAIAGCKRIAVFDKKIFFTGNPIFPNTVFWTSTDLTGYNNISYVGIYNFLNTGIGMTPNRDMVASSETLMIFKGDTVQDGSIYYLKPFDVENDVVPRYYSVTEGNAGIGCIGGAINFMDDTVFISKRGLDAVGKQLTNLERSIVHRSTNIDRKFLAEDLKNAQMVEWKGYLVISVNGHMYLADSRATYLDSTSNMQYEWFYLEGIGSYLTSELKGGFYQWNDNLSNVYRYWSGELPPDVDTNSKIIIKPDNNEEIIKGTLLEYGTTNKVWYSLETDEEGNVFKYLCYPSGEKTANEGAEFFPAEYLCVINDVLYFGTKQGGIYVFNTDKRGEIPESIYKDGKWLDSNYDSKEDFVGWIPQEYFSFDGLKYPSGIITKTDNVGVPYAVKNTINRSLVLRVGADPRTHSTITVEVLTDRSPTFDVVDKKESTESSFGMQDYEASSFDTYPFAFLTYREHKRKWIEKRYKIYNDAFCGILRLHSLSYRYEIGGNIKK